MEIDYVLFLGTHFLSYGIHVTISHKKGTIIKAYSLLDHVGRKFLACSYNPTMERL